MDHNRPELGAIHRVANDRKFYCHFTGFLEGVAASGMLEQGEVAPLLAECREFVNSLGDADASDILDDFEAELLEHDTVTLMVEVRAGNIDQACEKSALNRFLGYCRGIVCDNIITIEEAAGIVEMIEQKSYLIEVSGVREIYNTCRDAIQDGIVTPEEAYLICDAIGNVVGASYGDVGLSDVFGVANYEEHTIGQFPDELIGRSIVLTGTFRTSPRSQFERQLNELGAEIAKSVSGRTDFIVIGGTASPYWIEVNRGTKLRKAMELRLSGRGPLFISESQLLRRMRP